MSVAIEIFFIFEAIVSLKVKYFHWACQKITNKNDFHNVILWLLIFMIALIFNFIRVQGDLN